MRIQQKTSQKDIVYSYIMIYEFLSVFFWSVLSQSAFYIEKLHLDVTTHEPNNTF